MKKFFLVFSFFLLLFSCEYRQDIYKYCGFQLIEKESYKSEYRGSETIYNIVLLKDLKNHTLVKVYITKYDYDLYKIGDTIKCKTNGKQ